jgi:hypothetical protein
MAAGSGAAPDEADRGERVAVALAEMIDPDHRRS